jgi:conserved phage-related protein
MQWESRAGPCYSGEAICAVTRVKVFKTYAEQVELLRSRGMRIDNVGRAEKELAQLNYYRLSGYWYPMRRFSSGTRKACDEFVDGASFDLVIDLYEFDEQMRHFVFGELDRIEMAIRTMLGYRLGSIDPFIYRDVKRLSASARQQNKGSSRSKHAVWMEKFERAAKSSREDFVEHHRKHYQGDMPIWAAVEIMDWGMLSYLYDFSPTYVRDDIAHECRLTAPQLASWLKCLNIVRNYVAHHARIFNRVFDIKPKLSNDERLQAVAGVSNRSFGQLSLIQYLHRQLGLSPANRLPQLLDMFPHNDVVPLSRTGAPDGWQKLAVWER